jgi:small subunit ribosomal protein S9
LNFETLDTRVKVKGGGLIGQAEAIKLGIARALCDIEWGRDPVGQTSSHVSAVAGAEDWPNGPIANSNLSESKNNSEFTSQGSIRKQLKTKGFLTQDARVKERRKYGLKKARKASQYHKR